MRRQGHSDHTRNALRQQGPCVDAGSVRFLSPVLRILTASSSSSLMGSKSRKRSSPSPGQDIDDNEEDEELQPHPPSRPRRGHKPTTKQAQLGEHSPHFYFVPESTLTPHDLKELDKETMLESKLKAYEKKYKKLKDKNTREAAKRQKKRAGT